MVKRPPVGKGSGEDGQGASPLKLKDETTNQPSLSYNLKNHTNSTDEIKFQCYISESFIGSL